MKLEDFNDVNVGDLLFLTSFRCVLLVTKNEIVDTKNLMMYLAYTKPQTVFISGLAISYDGTQTVNVQNLEIVSAYSDWVQHIIHVKV